LWIEGALGQWGWESADLAVLAFAEESRLARFGSSRELQPRQVDSWAVQLTPYRELGAAAVRNAEAAIDLVDGEVRLQVSRQRLGHRLAIFTDDGRTLESPVDLYPEHRLELSLGDLVVAQVALLSPDREVVLTSAPAESAAELDTFSAGMRHAAYAQRGMAALRESRFEAAAEEFERSLLYNGDDPLCWWGQAFARRLAGGETEGDPSLANAHYLAPLEPVLRAEALLSQGVIEGAGPNPLLAPLAVAPEAFLVAANLLLETGQYTEATRFIDEALRHVDVPMLRYLLADALLSQTRMAAEAARQVGLAGRLGFGPPYPFGAAEFAALERLRARFPNDGVLAQFAALVKFGG
jgi:tetratricopeptide (TPR) repeat protein